MLTPFRPHFIEQVFTDQTGRQFRLVFLVSSVEGKLKGQLVSVRPMEARPRRSVLGGETSVFCLPIICRQNKTVTKYISSFAPIVSPFSTIEFLINSQPTRAPSHN